MGLVGGTNKIKIMTAWFKILPLWIEEEEG